MKQNIFFFMFIAFSFSSCKKETLTPAVEKTYHNYSSTAKPDLQHLTSFSDFNSIHNPNPYPMNYLQMGNYWIYGLQTNQQDISSNSSPWFTVYSDSVVVDGYKINAQGDTLYQVSSYTSLYPPFRQYFRMTAAGELKNEADETQYYFSSLPEVTDAACERKGCGSWHWQPYFWVDTTISYSTECCTFDVGMYKSIGETEYCPVGGWHTYYLVRGIGVVMYESSEWAYPSYSYKKNELLRFKLKH